MRNIFLILLSLSLTAVSSICFAEKNLWENELIQALQKAKTISTNEGGGLGYASTQDSLLEKAIKKAIEMNAPPHEAMKLAIDLKCCPYSVIKYVVGNGGEIDLKLLGMRATEIGIKKLIFAKAAVDAVSPLGTPSYSRDEITQAKFLTGLGYTPYADSPPPIKPTAPTQPVSATSVATEPEPMIETGSKNEKGTVIKSGTDTQT